MDCWRPAASGCWATTPGCGFFRLLAAERLNVTELTSILGLAQSGVSRHLGMLKEAGLVAEQREGVYAFYRLAAGAPGGGQRLRAALAAAPGPFRPDRRHA